MRLRRRLATKCASQRQRSRETAIERSTETARQRQLRALRLVSLLEPIFEEDAIEARFFSQRECRRGTGACWLACGNLEQAAEGRVIVVVVPLGSFRSRPVSVDRSLAVSQKGRLSVVLGTRYGVCVIGILATTDLGPAAALAQPSDVRNVMSPVPVVQRQHLIEIHNAILGMIQLAREIARRHRVQDAHPAIVQILEQ